MKRLATLTLTIILITGCNAMKPNIEETQLLSKEIEKRIYAQALPAEAPEIKESKPTPAAIIVREQEDEAPPTHSEPAATTKPTEKSQPENPVLTEKLTEIGPEPAPQPDKSTQESADHLEQVTPQQTGQNKENPMMIEWSYPAITCPPEPTPTPEPEWPYITTPEPPTYTPKPESTEQPQEQPAPTTVPVVPAVPADPVPEPMEPPTSPTPEPTAEPQTGYDKCSCEARLIPEGLVPHMKAHAMNRENHSYRAY